MTGLVWDRWNMGKIFCNHQSLHSPGKYRYHRYWSEISKEFGRRFGRLTRQISCECVHCVGIRWPKTTIWGKFWLFGATVLTPFYRWGQIWCAIADPWYTLTCQISSRSVYSVALCWRQPPIFAVFWIRHLVLSPIGNSLTKLNTGGQLQTFPYPTASK